MALTQNQTHVIGGTLLTLRPLGASVFPTAFVSGPNVMGGMIKLQTGGTAVILPNAIVGATIAGATAFIEGYPLSASMPISWVGPANFYVGAAGATCTVGALLYYGTGATLV